MKISKSLRTAIVVSVFSLIQISQALASHQLNSKPSCLPAYDKKLDADVHSVDKAALASLCPLAWPISLPILGLTLHESCAHMNARALIEDALAGWGPTLDKFAITLEKNGHRIPIEKLAYYIRVGDERGEFCAGKLATYSEIYKGFKNGTLQEAIDSAQQWN